MHSVHKCRVLELFALSRDGYFSCYFILQDNSKYDKSLINEAHYPFEIINTPLVTTTISW